MRLDPGHWARLEGVAYLAAKLGTQTRAARRMGRSCERVRQMLEERRHALRRECWLIAPQIETLRWLAGDSEQ